MSNNHEIESTLRAHVMGRGILTAPIILMNNKPKLGY